MLNDEGDGVISRLDQGVQDLRRLIRNEDIDGLSDNFEFIGSEGMRHLAVTTRNRCLKRVFNELANLDDSIADQLDITESPYFAGVFVCNILTYKAEQMLTCRK